MGNVGFVDIEELKKVREELNRERGIETDPNMYNNYNPNRANEEAANENIEQSSYDATNSETNEPQLQENDYQNITNQQNEQELENTENLGYDNDFKNEENEQDGEFNEHYGSGLDLSKFKVDEQQYGHVENEEELLNHAPQSDNEAENIADNISNNIDNKIDELDDNEDDFDINEFFNKIMGEGSDSEEHVKPASNSSQENQAVENEIYNNDSDEQEIAENEISEKESNVYFDGNEEEDFEEQSNLENEKLESNDLVEESNDDFDNHKFDNRTNLKSEIEDNEEKNFDVYDNFAEFEIKGYENNIPKEELLADNKEENSESDLELQEQSVEEQEENNEQNETSFEEPSSLETIEENEESFVEKAEKEPLEETDFADDKAVDELDENQENSVEQQESETENEFSEKREELDDFDLSQSKENGTSLYENEDIVDRQTDNDSQIELENQNSEEETLSENQEIKENNNFETETEQKIESAIVAESSDLESDSESNEEKFEEDSDEDFDDLSNFDVGAALSEFEQENDSEEDFEEEQTEFAEQISKESNIVSDSENTVKAYSEIKSYKFVDVLQSPEFKSSEKLSYLFGKDELNRLMFMNLRDMFNTAIFGLNEKSLFSYLSSMLLSLALKNSVNDVNFVICDSKLESDFEVFDKSSYMFFNRVAKTNREILDTLAELENELEQRYTMLAEVGTKSIEHYNKFASEAEISPMPYIIVVFNNYTRASGMMLGEQINICLSNLLKLGRKVGIYFVVSAYETIDNQFVNLNLSGRIAHRTSSEENSIFEVGTIDATRLEQDDEFVYTSVNGDEIYHLKTSKLSLNEVNLIIENLEK